MMRLFNTTSAKEKAPLHGGLPDVLTRNTACSTSARLLPVYRLTLCSKPVDQPFCALLKLASKPPRRQKLFPFANNQTFRLPHLYMTEEEQRVLKYLAHRYRHYDYDQADAVKRVAHLLERFTLEEQQMGSSELPVFSAQPKQLQFFELLSHAITDSRRVHIHYRDHDGEQQFSLCPLKMISQFNADYVVGYEADPVQQVAIRLEGIVHVSVSDERFEYRSDALLGGWEESLPVRKPFVAEIRLKEVQQMEMWQGYRIRASHDRIYSIEFYDTDAFLQHFLITIAPIFCHLHQRGSQGTCHIFNITLSLTTGDFKFTGKPAAIRETPTPNLFIKPVNPMHVTHLPAPIFSDPISLIISKDMACSEEQA